MFQIIKEEESERSDLLHRPKKIQDFFVIFSKNAKNDYDLIELKTHKNNELIIDTTKRSTATWQDEAFPD